MRALLPVLAVAGVVATGCASTTPWVSPEEHQRLVRQLLDLERRAATAELEIERLKLRLSELRTDGAPAPVPAPAAAPPARSLANESEPAPGWRGNQAPIEESELEELAAASDPALRAAASSYERGLGLLRDGRPGEAESALLAFAAAEPASDLADNAWFWAGESRLVRGDLAGAIEAYRSCIERYPEGNKVPDAMLKLGHALAGSGDAASAREVWSELARRFPSTAAAESARGRLAAP